MRTPAKGAAIHSDGDRASLVLACLHMLNLLSLFSLFFWLLSIRIDLTGLRKVRVPAVDESRRSRDQPSERRHVHSLRQRLEPSGKICYFAETIQPLTFAPGRQAGASGE